MRRLPQSVCTRPGTTRPATTLLLPVWALTTAERYHRVCERPPQRSPAVDLDEGVDLGPHRRRIEVEVLEDRVAVGPGAGGEDDGLGELLGREPQVGRDPRERVPPQAA